MDRYTCGLINNRSKTKAEITVNPKSGHGEGSQIVGQKIYLSMEPRYDCVNGEGVTES